MLPGNELSSSEMCRLRLHQLAGKKDALPNPFAGIQRTSDMRSEVVSRDRRKDSLEKLQQALFEKVVNNPATPLGRDEASRALDEADRALGRLALDGDEAILSPSQDIMLEAIIRVDGSRPSVPVLDGCVDPDDPSLGEWRDDVTASADAIRRSIASTGRLIRGNDLSETIVYGTAWVIGPGLIATAQHVLEELYVPVGDRWVERIGQEIGIDFFVEAGRPPRPQSRIRVVGVERPGPSVINGKLNLANLDAAILRLDLEGPEIPPALTQSTVVPLGEDPRIHIVGHPARPPVAPEDPTVPLEESAVMTQRILELILGDVFGVKRWAPGEFLTRPGTLADDVNAHVMLHDATTLGGNSGSPAFDFASTPDRVVGLHFAGRFRESNYLHPTAQIVDHLSCPGVIFV